MRILASKKATLLEHQDVGVLLLLIHAELSIKEIQVPMCLRVSGSFRVFISWFKVAEYLLLTLILCLSHSIILKGSPYLHTSRGEGAS